MTPQATPVPPPVPDSLLDVDETAAMLGVARSWVYAQTRRGALSCIPVTRVGRYARFRRRDLVTFIEAQTLGGARSTPAPLGLVRGAREVAR